MAPITNRTVTAFVQPADWKGPAENRPTQAICLALESWLDDSKVVGPVGFSVDEETRRDQKWSVSYSITKTAMDAASQEVSRAQLRTAKADLDSMMFLPAPDGFTPQEMVQLRASQGVPGTRWKIPDARILQLRALARDSAAEWKQIKAGWRPKAGKSWEHI